MILPGWIRAAIFGNGLLLIGLALLCAAAPEAILALARKPEAAINATTLIVPGYLALGLAGLFGARGHNLGRLRLVCGILCAFHITVSAAQILPGAARFLMAGLRPVDLLAYREALLVPGAQVVLLALPLGIAWLQLGGLQRRTLDYEF